MPKVGEKYRQNRRIKILNAARHVFITRGYNNATMQDVIDESGMSRGGVYAYFNNIEHVFIELLKFDDAKDSKVFIDIVEGVSLWSQFIEFLQSYQAEIKAARNSLVRVKSEFFLQEEPTKNEESTHYMTQRYINLKKAIEGFINKGQVQGDFSPTHTPEKIALYMISFLDGLTINSFCIGADIIDVDEQIVVLTYSLQALLNPKSEK